MSSNSDHVVDARGSRSSADGNPPPPCSSNSVVTDTDMKRAAAKKLIERYFYQLRDGCGNSKCTNEHCASSGKLKDLTPNEAAGLAIQLFRKEARLCESHPSKLRRTDEPSDIDKSLAEEEQRTSLGELETVTNSLKSSQSINTVCEPEGLTEQKLLDILQSCRNSGVYSSLIRVLGEIYSNFEYLGKSFLKSSNSETIDSLAPGELAKLNKEQVRALEGEQEKDVDCMEVQEVRVSFEVDMPSVQSAYSALFEIDRGIFENALVNAFVSLADSIEIEMRMKMNHREELISVDQKLINAALIAFEMPSLTTDDYMLMALPRLCKAVALFPISYQAKLAQLWATHSQNRLRGLLETLHHTITFKVINSRFSREYSVQDEDIITVCTKIMKIIYYASILAGELDSPDLREELDDDDDNSVLITPDVFKPPTEDPLGKELKINVLDSRGPLIPFVEFYNEPLSEVVEMDKDFANYKSAERESSSCPFSFMRYSFILTPATKILGLYYDNRIRMYSERRISLLQTVVGQPTNPYLRLKVHRDRIVDDALVELEMVSMENPKDFKKQLVVEFDGEQGVDEGGVSKEFFQLIVEEIFNPDYGMFVLQEESQTYWFNTSSFESEAQYTLIGIVIGLAIYNNIILDVHFPMVVYRKLMGKKGTFHDLQDWNQSLYNGLKSMLEYEDDDFNDTFMQTFRISYTDVFGAINYHDLLPDGDTIDVTKENRKEFVDQYADFLVNSSIEKQFKAFRKGFSMVTDESPLHLLFRPEEIEQLVCGSKTFNLKELEDSTDYDGGYTMETPVIQYFWEIVHAMDLNSQRKLLQFATGSDRVPVGGFRKLKLIISRNGPDSDRLPTAHTCYNVLLLPEYNTKEKLQDRLMKAITYFKGFGML